MSTTPAGYSGRPLAQKLAIKAGHVVCVLDAPAGFVEHGLGPLPADVRLHATLVAAADVVLTFRTERARLEADREPVTRTIFPAGAWWVCWPKRASKVPTDVTEDVVREIALPHGLVDTKVCAVDATWSGLRLVVRRERRGGTVEDLLSG
ncbi:DUF3052 family protein [Conexibacter sp. W3-3-2]|uniref:DUF3052 family protein n=1 Tax=Conexibacter sp. W3-3-2 TaxID=2675227 RepID=UPI0012B84BFA|nr:DUF3052 family protein [Conexibacter sp. W3-3-2]MTD43290.1 DUF3052 family protein [Conexibacter sp. W3-3-2]